MQVNNQKIYENECQKKIKKKELQAYKLYNINGLKFKVLIFMN